MQVLLLEARPWLPLHPLQDQDRGGTFGVWRWIFLGIWFGPQVFFINLKFQSWVWEFRIQYPQLVGRLEHQFYFPRNIGLLSSSQLTNSNLFQRGGPGPPTRQISTNIHNLWQVHWKMRIHYRFWAILFSDKPMCVCVYCTPGRDPGPWVSLKLCPNFLLYLQYVDT